MVSPMQWLGFLSVPFGYILDFCYALVKNYGIAIILLTLLIKILMAPLGIKQKKSTMKQLILQPKEAAIRRKYKDDKDKMNQAVMDLYEDRAHTKIF